MKELTSLEDFVKVDDEKDSIFLLSSNNPMKLPLHKHEKAQLCYAEGGATFLVLEDNTYLLPSRHYSWIPAGVEHQIWHKTHTDTIFTCYIPTSILPENDFYKKTGIYPVTPVIFEMSHYAMQWNGNLFPNDFRFKFISTLVDLLEDMKQKNLPFALPTTTNENMQKILLFIQTNLQEKITLETLGKKFGVSERTLSRNFQTHLRISFFQYLKLARIIRSIEMMMNKDMSISEIAFATGYDSISAFSNAFFTIVGKRPSEFKLFFNYDASEI
ncbi:AraC family transcriptional regulator [Cloacibacterium sp.]|uniref:AraC family transcriptional regulator n=1 Tax=Cloacibacterium sp. TaxID=1913682 RepID=UPI0039E22D79